MKQHFMASSFTLYCLLSALSGHIVYCLSLNNDDVNFVSSALWGNTCCVIPQSPPHHLLWHTLRKGWKYYFLLYYPLKVQIMWMVCTWSHWYWHVFNTPTIVTFISAVKITSTLVIRSLHSVCLILTDTEAEFHHADNKTVKQHNKNLPQLDILTFFFLNSPSLLDKVNIILKCDNIKWLYIIIYLARFYVFILQSFAWAFSLLHHSINLLPVSLSQTPDCTLRLLNDARFISIFLACSHHPIFH